MGIRKDQSLDALAHSGNVAQFVAFIPQDDVLVQQFSRVAGYQPNHDFGTLDAALTALIGSSPEGTINLRSYTPDSPRSREFVYAVATVAEATAHARRLAAEGLFVIANETVDIHDGGVSGVLHGNVAEFAPDDTPRCVEKAGVASLPRDWAMSLLETVYGFPPEPGTDVESRVEFSIHPRPRGWKHGHTLLWEHEKLSQAPPKPSMAWPNRFSRHIGDKVYGLMIADLVGVPVPRSVVFGRRVAPFVFGRATGSKEVWTRTAPYEPEPGRFTTAKGWLDPFRLMSEEDPTHERIASVLCQAAVPAFYSGAAIVTIEGKLHIEGLPGEGDGLMLGRDLPKELPPLVIEQVQGVFETLSELLGPVRFEWVHDGKQLWVVQLHRGSTVTSQTVLVPGEPTEWKTFEAGDGLEALRTFLERLPDTAGVLVAGDIGLTSHLADLIRKAKRPAKLSR